jgi:hypothetical protein
LSALPTRLRCLQQHNGNRNTATSPKRWGRALFVLALIVAAPILMMYFSDDHQRFIKFSEQRDAWHRKCDAYRDVKAGDPRAPIAAACARELEELTAYAKRQGWAN